MYNFSSVTKFHPEHKTMTHFAAMSQQFRVNFMPVEVIETVLPITQMTMSSLYDSFSLSLRYIWQMFNCLMIKVNQGYLVGVSPLKV